MRYTTSQVLALIVGGLASGGAVLGLGLATYWRMRAVQNTFAAWKRATVQVQGRRDREQPWSQESYTAEGRIETTCPGLFLHKHGWWTVRHQPSGLKVGETRTKKAAEDMLLKLGALAQQYGVSWNIPADQFAQAFPADVYTELRLIGGEHHKE